MTTMTSATDKTGTGVLAGAVSQPLGAGQAAAGAELAGDAGRRAGGSGPALRHDQFRTIDAQTARQFFARAYHPGWRITGLTGRSTVSHRRCEAGSLTVDDVTIQGRVAVEIPASDTVAVIQPRAGSMSVAGGSPATVDFPILVAQDMPCVLQCNGARFDVVSIAPDVLQKVAADWRPPLPQQIHFLDWRPRSRAAVRAWHRTLDHVVLTLAGPDTAHQPIIVAGLAPLLAGALLECYQSNLTEHDLANEPALPETLKDAVSFIHRHAAEDVSINDVAAAVHLTPRAVQYLFRRQLASTPTEYIRRVRLNRAHQELLAGAPSNTTVTEIAQRWGFAHTGRFAVLYRQTYGQSPHTTLRRMTSRP
ncbi:AraC family transcriptional regulator [Mycobacterium sp. E3251]|uniref:helix-turn-helix transcriptional regulator n=1 Tax=unclassified Mycobacterium TaxID=2642494 RepID=UPI0007FD7588|nr:MULTISPECIES: helix-turn-helix transcriptional regulator [unclassified Mycobacterium]OBG90705.1 AraC family transcriptional regulator [Mycobacterium sp. E3251]OBI28833.1 AraC family transcriptional regulator [Mycobacterium sp. E2238]OBI33282.1 AraC family transcriptional regulator [Mycobacterium sp. E1386]